MYLWEQLSSQMLYHLPSPVFLDSELPDRWMGRYRTTVSAPSSSFPNLTLLSSFFRGFVKVTIYREKVQNVTETHDRTVRAAECVVSTWSETEYCASNGAHTDIYWAHAVLCEVQSLNVSVSLTHFMADHMCFVLLSVRPETLSYDTEFCVVNTTFR